MSISTRMRDGVNTFLYGSTVVRCENCGATVLPNRAVWRGSRSYCSAVHEHEDLDTEAVRTPVSASLATSGASLRANAELVCS